MFHQAHLTPTPSLLVTQRKPQDHLERVKNGGHFHVKVTQLHTQMCHPMAISKQTLQVHPQAGSAVLPASYKTLCTTPGNSCHPHDGGALLAALHKLICTTPDNFSNPECGTKEI